MNSYIDVLLDQLAAEVALKADPELSELADAGDIEKAGQLLDVRAEDGFGPGEYWQHLRCEFWTMVCDEKAKRYEEIREQAKKAKQAGTMIGLPALSAVLAKYVGLESALVSPFVALLALSLIKTNIEAYCRLRPHDCPTPS